MAERSPAVTGEALVLSLISVLLILYVAALHVSMAAMEIIAWTLGAMVLVLSLASNRRLIWQGLLADKFLLIALALLTFWVGVTSSWFSLGFMRWAALLVLLRVGLELAWTAKFERSLVGTWCMVLSITGLYAVLQFFTGWDFVRPDRHLVNPQGGGVFKAIGFFSMSLTFAYAIGLSTVSVSTASLNRLGRRAWPILALGTLGVLASMSRGAWLSLVICIFIYAWFRARRVFLPLVLALGLGVVALATLNDGLGSRVRDMVEMKLDNSMNTRVHLWTAYSKLFESHPLLGVGLHDGHKQLPQTYEQYGIAETFVSHAHNVYLQWLAGTGVVGLLLYLFVCLWFLIRAWNLRHSSDWGWGLFLAQVFLHFGALTENNFFDGEVNHFIVFIWALTWHLSDQTVRASQLAVTTKEN